MTLEAATKVFQDIFKAKSGLDFSSRDGAPIIGKYQFKKPAAAEVEDEGESVMWQYYVDNGVDGKATGWYDYFAEAAALVEGIHTEWKNNSWLNVRCVQSGYWSYKVDFNTMKQTNTSTHTARTIRRVSR